MARPRKTKNQRTDDPQWMADCPSVWFCILERALRDGDKDGEKRARLELGLLGVFVALDPARALFVAGASKEGAK